MKKIKEFIQIHPVIASGISFGILSFMTNIIWIRAFNMAHIYDVIHVFPIIFAYEPIIDALGGGIQSQYIFMPMAIIIDILIGALVGLVIRRYAKTNLVWIISMILSFLIYFIVITYQWLPIL